MVYDLIPSEFRLFQNYPNPFKDKTTIKYCVAYKARVKITVFNSEGEMIEKLVDEEKEAGTYKIEFSAQNGTASGGKPAGSNLLKKDEKYLYRLEAGNYLAEKEMILTK